MELEVTLQHRTKKCDENSLRQNVDDLECLQAEYDELKDYITQEAIVRSRATWYKKKITSIFGIWKNQIRKKVGYLRI